MGVSETFRALVRKLVGLPVDEGQPPDLVRLGLYRARVDVCAADGSTLDVTPEDTRISPEKNVRLLVPIPGAVVAVSPGAVVHLGWEKGDPGRPYCTPIWEAGATLVSLSIGSNADRVVTKTDLDAVMATIAAAKYAPGPGTPVVLDLSAQPLPLSVGSTRVKVQR
jgi:hypothetical protein